VTREEAATAIRNSETLAERIIEAMPDDINSATVVMALANVFEAIATLSEHDGGATFAQAEELFHHRLAVLRERRRTFAAEAS
jgi:cysteinyl-tRNA synthetase